jgi:hypothetical protein
MLVLEPLKVVIENLPEEWEEMIEVPFSKDPAFGVSWNADTRTSSLLTRATDTSCSLHSDGIY